MKKIKNRKTKKLVAKNIDQIDEKDSSSPNIELESKRKKTKGLSKKLAQKRNNYF